MNINKKNETKVQQQLQNNKVKKNANIISILFWLVSSMYIYSIDFDFSERYSWKPFVFFIIGPIVAALIFGNIIYLSQKIIEKMTISFLSKSKPNLIQPVIVFLFFCFLVAIFLIIFKFAQLLQLSLN
jgi:hypothetical protein